jgi:osmotically-inducible protein OsmY
MVRQQRKSSAAEAAGSYPPRYASESIAGSWASHQIEQQVQHELMSQPSLHFSSLVVRRIDNGVCLQGMVETDEDPVPDVCRIARQVAGVDQVLNRLVVTRRSELPAEDAKAS